MFGWVELLLVVLPAITAAVAVQIGLSWAGIGSMIGVRIAAIFAALCAAYLSNIGTFAVAWTTDAVLPIIVVMLIAALLPTVAVLAAVLIARKIVYGVRAGNLHD